MSPIREIKGHKYKYLAYWDKNEKKQKQKYLGRVDIEKTTLLKMPTEKEAAEATIKIGGGLIERKHLEKWIKRLKFKENMDILKNLFVDNNQTIYRKTYITLIVEVNLWKKKNQRR